EADRAGGTWSQLFDRGSLANKLPPIAWWIAIEALGALVFPLLFLALRPLYDGGWLLAKPAGMLLLAYLSWLPPSLHLATYDRAEIMAVSLLLLASGTFAYWAQREAIDSYVKSHWRRLLGGELLFLALFGLFFLIRASNPDLWHPAMGGEKPMDFAFLNATLKTTYFPPYDPWFAGGYINYYYFGFVIVGTLIKLLGIVPAVAYNLAVPILPAVSCLAAFTIVASLVAAAGSLWTRRSAGPEADPPAAGVQAAFRLPIAGGLLAVVLVGLFGNFGEVALMFQGLQTLAGNTLHTDIPGLQGVLTTIAGLRQLAAGHGFPFRIEWWYWNATREIPDVINEFPFFTFVYGDLHAHAIALPYTLLAIGIGVAIVLDAANRHSDNTSRDWLLRVTSTQELAGLLLLGLVVGALKPTNTWDYPSYLLLSGALLLLADVTRHGRLEWAGVLRSVVKLALVAALASLFFYPYSRYFTTLYSSLSPWTGARTHLGPYLVVHGIFLAGIATFLLYTVLDNRGQVPVGRILRLLFNHLNRPGTVLRRVAQTQTTAGARQLIWYAIDATALFLLLLLALVLLKLWVPALLLLLIGLTAACLFGSHMSVLRRVACLLIGLGLCLSLATEFVVLTGDVGRMNTVFKLDFEVWLLWAVGAALIACDLLPRILPWRLPYRRAAGWAAALLLLSGLS